MEPSLSPENYAHLLSLAKKASALGSEVLLEYFGKLSHIDKKEHAGLVSEADIESEKVITEFLRRETPDIGIIAEEAHFRGEQVEEKEAHWIIDPLDGTTNYVHSFPVFCVSIGLRIGNTPVVGVVQAPKMDQIFEAYKGGGAFLNGNKISVSDRSDIDDCLVATGFFIHDKEVLAKQLELFRKVIFRCRGIRRPGAAAYDMSMVASGVFDGFWEQNLSPWDTCAGSVLITEAGGKVTNYNGEPFEPMMDSVLATNGHIHNILQDEAKTISEL